MPRDARLSASYILQAIANIEGDMEGHDFDSFRNDRRTRQLVERNLEILCEASRRLPADLKKTETGVEWPALAGAGDILRHDHHSTYPTVLWETCLKDLPPLKSAVQRMWMRLSGD